MIDEHTRVLGISSRGFLARILCVTLFFAFQCVTSAAPKVSVIVPVYNVEPYLRECLDSIVNQSLKEIEIICIEDCSTDNGLKILQEYAQKDRRIKIIRHPQNRGLSAARNSGLRVARGEYICFVDSDDYIHPDMYKIMYTEIRKGDYDVLMCDHKDVNKFEGDHWERNPVYRITEYGDASEIIELCFCRFISCNFGVCWDNFVVWNKLYKKPVIDRCKFAEEVYGREDLHFNICLDKFAKKYAFINAEFYHYRQRDGSIMHSSFTRKKVDADLIILKYLRTSPDLRLTKSAVRKVCSHLLIDALTFSISFGDDGVFFYAVGRICGLYCRGLISFGELLYAACGLAKWITIMCCRCCRNTWMSVKLTVPGFFAGNGEPSSGILSVNGGAASAVSGGSE
ncbi:MAG: glycosyltransferase [Holosporaceae bacterium]|nr:glycosyltransferase [Holosporaceae bacterium]